MSTSQKQPRGIKGLEGRPPVGAVLTIGTKGDRGAPVDRDLFYFKVPNATKQGSALVRGLHPNFGSFHHKDTPKKKRQTIAGVLVHATQDACFEYHRKAQVLDTSHPQRRPACVGDGVRAVRWVGGAADNFEDIPCPNRACEYALGKVKKCKPFARLLFRPCEPLPTPLCKFTTGSWNTVANLIGFFEDFAAQSKALGVENASLHGLPFELLLTEKTSSDDSGGKRFPVAVITPTMDVQGFLLAQKGKRDQLLGPQPIGLLDASEQAPEVVAADLAEINPGHPQVIDAEVIGGGKCGCGAEWDESEDGEHRFCGACGATPGQASFLGMAP